MYLSLAAPFTVESECSQAPNLEMRILVPDAPSPLRVGLAKVCWCEGRQFGVEFIQMPGEDQVHLGRLVKKEVSLAQLPQSRTWQEARS